MNFLNLRFTSFARREPERGTHFSRDLRRRSRSRSPINRRERIDATARTGYWIKKKIIDIVSFIFMCCGLMLFTVNFLLDVI